MKVEEDTRATYQIHKTVQLLFEEDEDLAEEFNKIFSSSTIPEADGKENDNVENDVIFPEYEYTPEVLHDTYLNVELALPQYNESPDFLV